MNAKIKRQLEIEKRDRIKDALIDGIERAEIYSKNYDKALCIEISLKKAGFKIVQDPTRKEI